MIKNHIKSGLLLAALFNVSAVYAEGWYVGLGAGTSNYDLPSDFAELESLVNEIDGAPGIAASFNAEDSDTALKIFAGKHLNENFAVEFGYVDLGEIPVDFSLTSDGTSFPAGSTEASSNLSVDGFNIGIVGSWPLSDSVSFNGRAGVYLWDAEGEFNIEDTTGVFENLSESISDDGNDTYYGLGFNIGWFGVSYEVYDDGDTVDFLGVSATFEMN